MPCTLSEAVAHLDSLLEPTRFKDYCPNGLQVPGKATVAKLATGVTASAELFEQAIAADADLVIVHHGLFWGSKAASIDAPMKRRLKLLFDADVALAGYHLPLDAHPEVGNNALIAKALGAETTTPFAPHEGEPIGRLASFPGEGIEARALFAKVAELTARAPLLFDAGPDRVRSLAIVSGGGAGYFPDAVVAKADAFLTGEPAERVMSEARETATHFIAAGHYATETFGVRRLGEDLAARFGLEHTFLDIPNPV
ncbi:MAG: Nif3-like dinuclear metal center hexameric protein [Solirubrobacteraceae bacterium]